MCFCKITYIHFMIAENQTQCNLLLQDVVDGSYSSLLTESINPTSAHVFSTCGPGSAVLPHTFCWLKCSSDASIRQFISLIWKKIVRNFDNSLLVGSRKEVKGETKQWGQNCDRVGTVEGKHKGERRRETFCGSIKLLGWHCCLLTSSHEIYLHRIK